MSDPLVKEIEVRCSVEHAFDVFTQRIDLWWPESHRPKGARSMHLDAHVGGMFYALRDGGERVELGRVIEVERPRRLAYTWNPGGGTGPTAVEVSFAAADDVSIVRVVHEEADSGLGAEWPERVGIFAGAWDNVLFSLAQFVDQSSEKGEQ